MNTEGFDKLDTLLRTLRYEQLSTSEKAYVENEIGGEKAYRQVQTLMAEVRQTTVAPVSAQVKKDLMRHYKQTHQSVVVRLLHAQTPVYLNIAATAALLVLFWLIMPAKQVEIPKLVTVHQIDTVTVQSPADTVYIRETIRVQVPVQMATNATLEKPKDEEVQGSSLKDQKALLDLLAQTSP